MQRHTSFFTTLAMAGLGVGNFACTSVLGTFTDGAGGASASSASSANGGATSVSSTASSAGGTTATGSMDPCAACSPNATCNAGKMCECNPGFDGDGTTCSDVDECAASPAPCGANENCKNTSGSFQCTCAAGFTLDAQKSCVPIWTQVGAVQKTAIGGFGSFVAGSTTKLFVANNGAAGAFFLSFDLAKKAFASEVAQPSLSNDFCGCGLTATLATFDTQLFSLGNYGQVYEAGVWKKVSPYVDPFRRGEAASATFEKTIFILGGRDNAGDTDTLLSYSLSLNTFTKTSSPYIFGPVSSPGMATFKGLLFAAGGLTFKDQQANHAALLNVSTMKWQQVADAPINAEQADVALFNDNFVLANGKELVAFSLGDNAWSQVIFTFPTNLAEARLVGTPTGQAFAIGNMGSNLQVYALNILPK